MSDIQAKEEELVRTTLDSLVIKSEKFNTAVGKTDILTMTELFVDLESEHLMLLSDIVSDPELKTELMQSAIAVRAQSESSRFFLSHK